jgi:hypothetical protein
MNLGDSEDDHPAQDCEDGHVPRLTIFDTAGCPDGERPPDDQTMDRYLHAMRESLDAAIAALLNLSGDDVQSARRTGTDDALAASNAPDSGACPAGAGGSTGGNAARCGSSARASEREIDGRAGEVQRAFRLEKHGQNEASPRTKTSRRETRPAGFEPATCGLGNRCSVLLSYGR